MLTKIQPDTILFPHRKVRKIQSELIKDIISAFEKKSCLIAHAPTGLGKTAASIAPALKYALENKLTIFFLTSRHTQHKIAVDTLKKIKEKYSLDFSAIDIIGKKHMCPVPGIENLYSNEFSEYCKQQKEEGKCEFYQNTRKKNGTKTVQASKIIDDIKPLLPMHCEDLVKFCSQEKLCPYEISTMIAKEAKIIIADYYYIFNPSIQQLFFNKTEKTLKDSIIIVDEAHNLPGRMRELATTRITTAMLIRGIRETQKYGFKETENYLNQILDILIKLSEDVEEEKIISKDEFYEKVNQILDYQELIANLEFIGSEIREKQKKSYVSSIANFLETWLGQDQSYARYIKKAFVKKHHIISLVYRCLDPSLLTKDIISQVHSVIAMSGTLTPTNMYADILGFKNPVLKEYKSPFPEKNKLSLIIPKTTTKFTKRNPEQYKEIARITAQITNLIPGNSAVFFPSYRLRDDINNFFQNFSAKTTFLEQPGLTKTEKQELLEKFKSYRKQGAVLLGVASGSFGEGIDLPGDYLKAVVVAGLPLQKPDLEIQKLIEYYDKKFGKGWDYGYVFPAITKCLQSAGRCIRSETDKGAVIFLDERFAWPNYKRCFPPEWDIKITHNFATEINEFF